MPVRLMSSARLPRGDTTALDAAVAGALSWGVSAPVPARGDPIRLGPRLLALLVPRLVPRLASRLAALLPRMAERGECIRLLVREPARDPACEAARLCPRDVASDCPLSLSSCEPGRDGSYEDERPRWLRGALSVRVPEDMYEDREDRRDDRRLWLGDPSLDTSDGGCDAYGLECRDERELYPKRDRNLGLYDTEPSSGDPSGAEEKPVVTSVSVP